MFVFCSYLRGGEWRGGGRGKCGSAWVRNDIEGEEIRHENKCV